MPGEPAIGDQDAVGRQGSVQLAAEPRHVDRPFRRVEPCGCLVAPCRHPLRNLGDVFGASGAGLPSVVGERFGEVFEPGAGIAPQRHFGRPAAADLLGDNLQVNERDRRRGQRIALGGDLAELAADHDETVRRLDQLVRDPRIAAEEASRERVGAGNAALAAHRVRDRDRLRLREGQQCFVPGREMDAAADQDQRTPGARHQCRGARDVGRRERSWTKS